MFSFLQKTCTLNIVQTFFFNYISTNLGTNLLLLFSFDRLKKMQIQFANYLVSNVKNSISSSWIVLAAADQSSVILCLKPYYIRFGHHHLIVRFKIGLLGSYFCTQTSTCRNSSQYIRGFTKSQITVAFCLKFYWYLRTLSLKFQKFTTKNGVFLTLPS